MTSSNISELSDIYTLDVPDMDIWPKAEKILTARVSSGDIYVDWEDGRVSRFQALWLREQCPCIQCHSEITRETLFDITDLSIDVQAKICVLDADGYLIVQWDQDGHESRYHPGWLRANCYDDWARTGRETGKPTWDKDFEIPAFEAGGVLEDDDQLYDWLVALDRYGLTRLYNASTDTGTVEKVANRIGQIRPSNFGSIFEVVSRPDANSNAYLSVELPLHMDLPTRETPPGLQFLHCIVNDAEGGESLFADAFHVAKFLKQTAPEVYEIVTTVDYPFRNRALDCDYRTAGPLIRLDADGHPVESRINTFLTAPITHLPHDQLKKALEARHHLMRLVKEDRFRVQFKLRPGEIVAFDNRRALHARTEFFPNTGNRLLEGCYLDRDDLHSALNMQARRKRCEAIRKSEAT
ncbi:MAG: TauD/TfdA family dioxygenase [Proteobacteria bacterium]|nr:TauD/TfdA family dioxygenase [Pseudomonadota bacterium]